MIFLATTQSGKTVSLENVLNFSIHKDEKTPADALHAVFSCDKIPENFTNIKLEGATGTLFWGLVDEIIFTDGESGKLLEIYARSIEALLLDNEAMPQTIFFPSVPLLKHRFLSDLGFSSVISEQNDALSAEFVVHKGSSVYEVLSNFAENYLSTSFHVLDNNTVLFGEKDTMSVYEDDTPEFFEFSRNNYDVCSHMYYKDASTGAYATCFENEKAKGILRIRFAQNSIPPFERFKVYETYHLKFPKLIPLEIDDNFEFYSGEDRVNIKVKNIEYSYEFGKEESEISGVREV